MKRWTARILLVAVLVMAGVWGWRTFFPNPERVIRERFEALARTASFSARESGFAKLDNSTRLAAFCAPDVEITVDIPGAQTRRVTSRDRLLEEAMTLRSIIQSLSVEFVDMVIQLSPDKNSAVVELTARATTPRDRDPMIQELKFSLTKTNGDWLIQRVETVKTLL